MLQVIDSLGDGLEHLSQLVLKPGDLHIDNIIIHLPPAFLIDQIIMDIRLLGQPLHVERHLLLVNQLGDVYNEGVDVMPAVLFFEQAGRTR